MAHGMEEGLVNQIMNEREWAWGYFNVGFHGHDKKAENRQREITHQDFHEVWIVGLAFLQEQTQFLKLVFVLGVCEMFKWKQIEPL